MATYLLSHKLRSKEKLISDVLLWTFTPRRRKTVNSNQLYSTMYYNLLLWESLAKYIYACKYGYYILNLDKFGTRLGGSVELLTVYVTYVCEYI